jgi:hypothetical protein
MDGSRFDEIARGMAKGSTRRSMLKALGGGALAALGLARTGGGADADTTCKPAAPKAQSKCTKDGQCCTGLVCQTGNCQSGCRINGTFYASGAPHPANPCQACQPSVSTTQWSNTSDGTTCGTDEVCTGGTCGCAAGFINCGQGCVPGECCPITCRGIGCFDPRCDDGDDGTIDTCVNNQCQHFDHICDDGDDCTTVGYFDYEVGFCVFEPKFPPSSCSGCGAGELFLAIDGTPCDDGDGTGTCSAGTCVPN